MTPREQFQLAYRTCRLDPSTSDMWALQDVPVSVRNAAANVLMKKLWDAQHAAPTLADRLEQERAFRAFWPKGFPFTKPGRPNFPRQHP